MRTLSSLSTLNDGGELQLDAILTHTLNGVSSIRSIYFRSIPNFADAIANGLKSASTLGLLWQVILATTLTLDPNHEEWKLFFSLPL